MVQRVCTLKHAHYMEKSMASLSHILQILLFGQAKYIMDIVYPEEQFNVIIDIFPWVNLLHQMREDTGSENHIHVHCIMAKYQDQVVDGRLSRKYSVRVLSLLRHTICHG